VRQLERTLTTLSGAGRQLEAPQSTEGQIALNQLISAQVVSEVVTHQSTHGSAVTVQLCILCFPKGSMKTTEAEDRSSVQESSTLQRLRGTAALGCDLGSWGWGRA
jgi:hypothetical protein